MGVKSSPFCAAHVNLSARRRTPLESVRIHLDVVHEAQYFLLVEDRRYRAVYDFQRDVYGREVACREL